MSRTWVVFFCLIAGIAAGQESIDFQLLGKTSFTYSDAGPDGFRLDSLGFKALFDDGNIRASVLAETAPDVVVKEAWVWASFFKRKEWLERAYVKIGLLRVPFGHSQRFLEHDLTLGYPLVALGMFDNWLGFFDLGVAFGCSLPTKEGTLLFEAAVLRGEYLGGEETDKAKALCAQVLLVPVHGVMFGVSWYDGSRVTYYDAAHPAIDTNHDRLGFHALFRFRGLRVLYEFIHGNDGNAVERDRNSLGYCAEIGLFIKRNFRYWDPEKGLFCGTQLVFRIDAYRPPRDYQMRVLTGKATRTKITYTFGLSFALTPAVRVLLFFSHLDWGPYFEGRLTGQPTGDDRAGLVLFLRF